MAMLLRSLSSFKRVVSLPTPNIALSNSWTSLILMTVVLSTLLAMKQIHHFHGELNEESESVLIVDLPFRCDTRGFYDPINKEQNELDLGIFPLPNAKEQTRHAPLPSTRFLHLMCQELVKPKVEQKTKTRSYFSPPPVSNNLHEVVPP
jgi:hypothetical protein